jgi:DNA-binding CsgD family transcriptional regulator/tetratricopeptide (TPR) repeat protein
LIGRIAERRAVGDFLAASTPRRTLLLTGEAGIGKTTLWEAGVADACERGWRVLSARPSAAEAGFGFAGLGDLLGEVGEAALAELPPPQRRALEVVLLRAEPAGRPPEPRAIAVAAHNVLRALAAAEPLLVAVDDVQWLDRPSGEVLAFSARRLDRQSVAFFLSRRPGDPSPLEQALRPDLERLQLAPLSLGAARRILFERLDLTLSRRAARRAFELSLGNPLFVLEIGRMLRRREPAEFEGEMPVPESVEELLGTRVAELPPAARRALLAVAISADLSRAQLSEFCEPADLEAAFAAGTLTNFGSRVRAGHPLLAHVAAAGATPAERRSLHLALAEATDSEMARARHLALATSEPDRELAATVAAAAAAARARGAAEGAVELGEQALRLTPREAPERGERIVDLADLMLVAGRSHCATQLLRDELEALPRGAIRARALLLLAEGDEITTVGEVEAQIEAALREGRGDPEIEATARGRQAEYAALCSLERLGEAERSAERGLRPPVGGDAERVALNGLGWTRILRGRAVDDLCERFDAISDSAFHLVDSLQQLVALRHFWRGELGEARAIFERLRALAEERAEPLSSVAVRNHRCELALRAGEWDEAAALLDEWEMDADKEMLVAPQYERCRALLAAGRGDLEAVEEWAAETVAGANECGVRWDLLEAERARAVAALLAGAPEAAVERLAPIWERMVGEEIDEPGVFPVAPDLVEALLAIGDAGAAVAVSERLRGLAESQCHPWGLAGAERCAAQLALAADDYDPAAAARLAAAADSYEQLGLRFDAGRSLLALGRAQRRRRQWGAARASLERAAVTFDALGSDGWAVAARAALDGIGGRRPRASGDLTPAELRSAELAARGLSNKEIARTAFVTVRTVESHLSRAYAKLGVSSRTRLAARLSEREDGGG